MTLLFFHTWLHYEYEFVVNISCCDCKIVFTSLCILLTTELQKSKRVLFVSSPDSNTTHPYYIDDNCKLSTLQSMIREKLGISPSHQKLYNQGKLLSDDNQLASLPTESNIQLLMHLKGGGPNCEICNEPGEYKCEQRFQNILCKECCN